jgi:hypothetical protein
MRYRLRTLLITVTLVAVRLAGVSFLRRMAEFHQREHVRLVSEVVAAESISEPPTKAYFDHIIARDWPPRPFDRDDESSRGFYKSLVAQLGGEPYRHTRDVSDETAGAWKSAIKHFILASDYDRALSRPWNVVFIANLIAHDRQAMPFTTRPLRE